MDRKPTTETVRYPGLWVQADGTQVYRVGVDGAEAVTTVERHGGMSAAVRAAVRGGGRGGGGGRKVALRNAADAAGRTPAEVLADDAASRTREAIVHTEVVRRADPATASLRRVLAVGTMADRSVNTNRRPYTEVARAMRCKPVEILRAIALRHAEDQGLLACCFDGAVWTAPLGLFGAEIAAGLRSLDAPHLYVGAWVELPE